MFGAGKLHGVLLSAVLIFIAGPAARAHTHFGRDRIFTYPVALNMAKRAQETTSFPIVMNAQVLRQLNAMLKNAQLRASMKRTLDSLEEYRDVLERIFIDYGVP